MTEHKNIQVRNYILSLLESGAVDGECKLPGALELAGRLNISLLTVQNALATLANEGVLKIIPRQGTFVDQNWRERILQTNIGFYVPCNSLPWGAFFAERIRSRFPQLHISSEMRNAVFEIRPTLDVQMNHKQYLDLAPLFESCFSDRSCFFEAPLNAFYYGRQLVGLPFLFSHRCKCVVYTQGKDGATLYRRNDHISAKGHQVQVVDTTGAGDSFIGAFLYCLLTEESDDLEAIPLERMKHHLEFANLYAAHTTTMAGALAAMADQEQLREFHHALYDDDDDSSLYL